MPTRGDDAKSWRPSFHLSTDGSNYEMLEPTGWLGRNGAFCYSFFFGAIPKIFRAIHTGATNTWAGLVRNAGLFPSTQCPSHASAKAAGISSRAIIQCHQTTITDEKPTGMAI